jgi:hypothetical protein
MPQADPGRRALETSRLRIPARGSIIEEFYYFGVLTSVKFEFEQDQRNNHAVMQVFVTDNDGPWCSTRTSDALPGIEDYPFLAVVWTSGACDS